VSNNAPDFPTKFRRNWGHYVYQTFLATLSASLVFVFLKSEGPVIVASLGATTFVVFAMPKSRAARARNVVGGHIIGVLCGTVAAIVGSTGTPLDYLVSSGAVGLSMFLMLATGTQHPPASGTALSIAAAGRAQDHVAIAVTVVASAVILSLLRLLLRRHLEDLE